VGPGAGLDVAANRKCQLVGNCSNKPTATNTQGWELCNLIYRNTPTPHQFQNNTLLETCIGKIMFLKNLYVGYRLKSQISV
jgi:hypothetical protein